VNLRVGDLIAAASANGMDSPEGYFLDEALPVTYVYEEPSATRVYNFEVEGGHTYFASRCRLLVHNGKGCTPDISSISEDWLRKGAHVKVGGVELLVLPGEGGRVVLKPYFSSTARKTAEGAMAAGELALRDRDFVQRLLSTVDRAIPYAAQNGNPGKSAEFHFLSVALNKLLH
jgi:hypothetical protein